MVIKIDDVKHWGRRWDWFEMLPARRAGEKFIARLPAGLDWFPVREGSWELPVGDSIRAVGKLAGSERWWTFYATGKVAEALLEASATEPLVRVKTIFREAKQASWVDGEAVLEVTAELGFEVVEVLEDGGHGAGSNEARESA